MDTGASSICTSFDEDSSCNSIDDDISCDFIFVDTMGVPSMFWLVKLLVMLLFMSVRCETGVVFVGDGE